MRLVEKTRVFLVDDQQELVNFLLQALQTEFDIVGVAHSGEAALLEAPELSPEVFVLDVSLPGMSGIEAAERLKTMLPDVKIVTLSMHSDDVYVTEAFNAGASAYVVKTSGFSELVRAIREAQAGNQCLSPLHQGGR